MIHPFMLRSLLIIILLVGGSCLADDEDIRLLQENGVEPNAAGISKYLSQFQPNSPLERWTRKQLHQLDDPDFRRREQLTKWLIQRPLLSEAALRQAHDHPSAEVARRSRRILRERVPSTELLDAAFGLIDEFTIPGLLPHILKAVEHSPDSPRALAAIRSTVEGADAAKLEPLLPQLTPRQQELAGAALASIHRRFHDTAGLDRLLTFPSSPVAMGAAYSLALDEQALGFERLIDFLESPDIAENNGAIERLRRLTGKRFDYATGDLPAVKALTANRWREYVRLEGRLRIEPLRPDFSRILCTIYRSKTGEVLELSPSGKVRHKQSLHHRTWHAQALPNGNRLFVNLDKNQVTEYNPARRKVWNRNLLPDKPCSVQRLDNGNTLIACREGNAILEINKASITEWSVQQAGGPTDARRLRNGNTLITLQEWGEVVELDAEGETVWRIEDLQEPSTARRLENGNTLIAEHHGWKVSEIARDGTRTWTWHASAERGRPLDAIRLINGHTLIATTTSLIEVDREGELLTLLLDRPVARIELIP